MTAEIVLMNKEAVAIAADSAVTYTKTHIHDGNSVTKIYNSANKLFAISYEESVAIMIYGNATFMDIPWETVINHYRDHVRTHTLELDSLRDWAEDFVAFMKNAAGGLIDDERQMAYFSDLVSSMYFVIAKAIVKKLEDEYGSLDALKEEEVADISLLIQEEVTNIHDNIEVLENHPNISDDFASQAETLNQLEEKIKEILEFVFSGLPLNHNTTQQLIQIALNIFKKDSTFDEIERSGIVITGFGREDIFPSCVNYEIASYLFGALKYKRTTKSTEITDLNSASIIPFAQDDVVSSFIEGIHPATKAMVTFFLDRLLNEHIKPILVDKMSHLSEKTQEAFEADIDEWAQDQVESFSDELHKHMHNQNIEPMLDILQILPKDEMAEMAESLVSITSFRRRISFDQNTVGGPVDVAVISKKDGLVWIKRKHYFDANLNQHFTKRYNHRSWGT